MTHQYRTTRVQAVTTELGDDPAEPGRRLTRSFLAEDDPSGILEVLVNELEEHLAIGDVRHSIPSLLAEPLMRPHWQLEGIGDDLTRFPCLVLGARHHDVRMLVDKPGRDRPRRVTAGVGQDPSARVPMRIHERFGMAHQND